MNNAPDLNHKVLSEAADWFALLRSGSASEQDRTELQLWLAAHTDHRRSWQLVESVEQNFNTAAMAGPIQAEQTLANVRQRRLNRRNLLGGLVLFVGAGALGWRYTGLPRELVAMNAQYRSQTGEIKALTLTDGSQLWLNTNTALNTDVSGDTRTIELLRGELLIETGKADMRPLIVNTTHGRLRPLGTRFTVRDDGESGFVAVFDGAVEINSNGQQQVLLSGQQTRYHNGMIDSPRPADPARETWHRGVLLAEDIRLQDLLNELERYRPGVISVSEEVADLRVFGGYPLTDPDRALAMLEQALPIQVRHPLPWWVGIDSSK